MAVAQPLPGKAGWIVRGVVLAHLRPEISPHGVLVHEPGGFVVGICFHDTSGLSAATDAIVEITGFSGNLSQLQAF